MPLYRYQCCYCQTQETRIAGLDDYLAICHLCGQVMVRLDFDLFAPYYAEQSATEPASRTLQPVLGQGL